MAEVIAAIGIAASVAQLADYGFKLSVKLYSFSQAVSSAESSIREISNDVSLTSTVLQELCLILKDDKVNIVSAAAVESTERTVKQCLLIFEELSSALDKSLDAMGEGNKKGRVTLEKLKWPFKQTKMELLRGNLDRLKASLTLMLQVLSYARSISSRKEMEASFEYQKQLIESLARSERVTRKRYEALKRAIEGKSKGEDAFGITINTSREINEEDFSTNVLERPSNLKEEPLIGELLLSFKLFADTLTPHFQRNFTSEARYENLRSMLDDFELKEGRHLGEIHGQASPSVKAEAARKIQARLRHLLQPGYPDQHLQEDVPPQYEPTTQRSHYIPITYRVDTSHLETTLSGSISQSVESPARLEPEQYDPCLRSSSFSSTSQFQDETDTTAVRRRCKNVNEITLCGGRRANRVREDPQRPVTRVSQAAVTQAPTGFGSQSRKGISGNSGAVYEAGSSLFGQGDHTAGGGSAWPRGVRKDGEEVDEEEEEEELPDHYVDDLLHEWTTLPRGEEEQEGNERMGKENPIQG